MVLKVTVSFKNSDKEVKVYDWLTRKSGYSAFIKDLLVKEMEREEQEKK